MEQQRALVGCAGWNIPAMASGLFPEQGTHLKRYAAQFRAVEVNSSFYRHHRGATYGRWAETVSDAFRFSVKMPRTITHDSKLRPERSIVDRFVDEISHLGTRLGCVLVQFPPGLHWQRTAVREFLEMLRERIVVPIACEPRHKSWFTSEAEADLNEFRISRVATDPCLATGGESPGGWTAFAYYRLHGSPRIYYSTYDADFLARLAKRIQKHLADGNTCWCIFDNTAAGAAPRNALDLCDLIYELSPRALAAVGTSSADD